MRWSVSFRLEGTCEWRKLLDMPWTNSDDALSVYAGHEFHHAQAGQFRWRDENRLQGIARRWYRWWQGWDRIRQPASVLGPSARDQQQLAREICQVCQVGRISSRLPAGRGTKNGWPPIQCFFLNPNEPDYRGKITGCQKAPGLMELALWSARNSIVPHILNQCLSFGGGYFYLLHGSARRKTQGVFQKKIKIFSGPRVLSSCQ